MRALSDTLLVAQKSVNTRPLTKLVLTHNSTTHTYTKTHILKIKETGDGSLQSIEIVLKNKDKALTDLDLRGYQGVLSYGAITASEDNPEEDSALAPMKVIDQEFDSDPNKLECTLTLVGICNLMAEDKALGSYMPDEDDTKSVKTLINELIGASMAGFTNCQSYGVVWEDGYDTLADTYKPKDSFRVYEGNNRLAKLNQLLSYTKNVALPKADGKVHIFKPTTSGETYDYEYILKDGHPFFAKALRNRLVMPNRILVRSQVDDDPYYEGEAVDSDSYDLLPKFESHRMRLESNDQATAIAEAKLAQAKMWSEAGSASVPMNVGQEVYDYVKVTDSREGDYRVGNIGKYVRHYDLRKDEWRLTFTFGNWQNVRKALAQLGITIDDVENYFSRFQSKDAYIENLLAKNMGFYWIDPENNIDLDKIGDTLDNLPNGEVFAKVKSIHVDAEGGIKLDENILYSPGYDPTEKFDLNNNDFDDIPEGTVYRRTKSAALSASGMVLLDQVVVGTYGLVKKTDIYAGHIILGTAIADGEWYRETGISIDADKGIAAYGADMSFATFADRADYLAGNYQCKVDSSGAIVAAAGNIKFDSDGGHFKGENLKFYYSTTNYGSLYVSGDTGHPFTIVSINSADILLRAASDLLLDAGATGFIKIQASLQPYQDGVQDIGSGAKRIGDLYVVTLHQGDTIFANDWKLTETPDNKGMMLLRPDGSIAQEWR